MFTNLFAQQNNRVQGCPGGVVLHLGLRSCAADLEQIFLAAHRCTWVHIDKRTKAASERTKVQQPKNIGSAVDSSMTEAKQQGHSEIRPAGEVSRVCAVEKNLFRAT